MNIFARFDENPAMNLQDIKKKKTFWTDGQMHRRTHGQRENSIPTTNKVCVGYKDISFRKLEKKLRCFYLVQHILYQIKAPQFYTD